MQITTFCSISYLVLILCSKVLVCFVQVVGEYAHLNKDLEPDAVLRLLVKLLDMRSSTSETKSWVLMAMTKLCSGGAALSVAREVSETYVSSMDTVLRQRAQELQHLSQDSALQSRVLPRSGSQEPVEVTHMLACRAAVKALKGTVI